MKTNFIGTGVAMITPFKEDKSVDFKAIKNVIEHLIAGKVDYILVMGTTAESATLSFEEKNEILAFAKKEIAGRVPIMYGLGGNNTADVIDKIKKTDLSGVDGILTVAPYYNKPNQEGLYQHFAAIAVASPVPLILYNVPGRTVVNIKPETVVRLANDFENIVAIKEACGSVDQIMELIRIKPADFTVISGDDGLTMPLICAGVEGVISVIANAYPKEWSDMVRFAMKYDFESAKQIHYRYLPDIDYMFAEGNPAGVKAYMTEMGLIENNLRLPMVNVSEKLLSDIKKSMKII
ncbi:MAG: 4-hydroxy-tetrahydrodipicolinate synthase [Marinilabiliales bacterium]|nr:MAG: 4-hydroxy-tetrahydrodipicolinate synthase [Marinilabiliales bacterium]